MEKDINKQLEVIRRGAVDIISEPELKEKLERSIAKNKPLRIKAGFDPTAPDLHLGHTVLLRKLKQFQDLGHKIFFLIGDFTGRIGDPTGRSELRKQLSAEEVAKNAQTYKKQVSKILDMDKIDVVFNSDWFDKMHGLEFGQLLTHYTATRLLERNDFTLRLQEKKPIYMSEFIYPILQGYDSVKLEADIELGGTDQIFNLLVGRDIQKDFAQAQQVVITMPLLEGTDGVQKMSKSYGNYIGINEDPGEMFGKIMSISDELMFKYYTLLTDEDLDAAKAIHPKEAKMKLAEIIVSQYHSAQAASKARLEFDRVFSSKELPDEIEGYRLLSKDGMTIIDILVFSKVMKSRNDARRLVEQGGVSFDGIAITDANAVIKSEGVLKIGKKRFLKILVR
jgi:tyrosyl-tRNA synthetase